MPSLEEEEEKTRKKEEEEKHEPTFKQFVTTKTKLPALM